MTTASPEKYPSAVHVSRDVLRRTWTVEVRRVVPNLELEHDLAEAVRTALETAFESDAATVPWGIQTRSVSDKVLSVQTDFPAHHAAHGDDAAIVRWIALRRIHERCGIHRLQGLPATAWFQLEG